MKIIFMGTPEFAVPSLDILVQNGYDVVAVITSTDKYGGRGNKKLLESAVKKYAVKHGIKVLQPKNLKKEAFHNELWALKADLQVVVAFRMLPEAVWSMPPLGTINLHGSLLPKYRGAAPINWAVINGDKETGATTFFIQQQIDTGNLLLQETMPIHPDDTAGNVHDTMMEMGAGLLLKTVKAIESRSYKTTVQDESLVSHAPKIFHKTCKINFDQPVQQVYNFIRGLSPYPTAWTVLNDLELKIYKAEMETEQPKEEPGTFVNERKRLKIATKDGYILVKELQLQGKKRMDIQSFLNGYKF